MSECSTCQLLARTKYCHARCEYMTTHDGRLQEVEGCKFYTKKEQPKKRVCRSCDQLQRENAELRARVGVMARALDIADRLLEEAQSRLNDENFYNERPIIEGALSSDAGREMVELVEAARDAADLLMIDCEECSDYIAGECCLGEPCDVMPTYKRLREVLKKLDGDK